MFRTIKVILDVDYDEAKREVLGYYQSINYEKNIPKKWTCTKLFLNH